ncbi:MAG: hypothetical protein MUE85_16335 [Microscillaceae bacterium]|jgi:hypothetical protein|nr:hypothetical protein [Microscillaceae bacterium]
MKKDIEFPAVVGVQIAIAKQIDEIGNTEWRVFLLNHNQFALENVLITSQGYSIRQDNKPADIEKTSTLRHLIPLLESQEYALIEPIDPSVFHLCNEYWLSYYVNGKIYDKKFIFMPDSIVEENLQKIEMLNLQGILHS